MADPPARRDHDAAGDESEWDSPVPLEYGSLSNPPRRREPDRGAGRRSPDAPPAKGSSGRGNGAEPGLLRRAIRSAVRPPGEEPAPDWEDLGLAPAPAAGSGRLGPPAARRGPDPGVWPQSAPPDAAPARARPKPPPPDGPPAPARRRSESPPAPAPATRRRTAPPGPPAPISAPADDGGWASIAAVTNEDTPSTLRRDRTPPRPRPTIDATPEPSRARGRRQWAQSRWTVRHLSVWSVAKVSLVFYLILLAAFVVASVLLWYLADAFGAVSSIEKSGRTLFSLKTLTIHPSQVALYTALGGAVLSLVGTLFNILGALMYNLISDLIGGFRIDVVDTDK